jgi:hypothetical protein
MRAPTLRFELVALRLDVLIREPPPQRVLTGNIEGRLVSTLQNPQSEAWDESKIEASRMRVTTQRCVCSVDADSDTSRVQGGCG